ncbi:MAG: flagellar hook-basal body complex protein [Lachnospiraceae bacterium]|nr:flagellar hook-basal body complex protein [Lachnospiraceae bacterium]
MMRSLYSGVAGLKTHQTKMDVIGNNIANVNTTAFKASSITFSELMSQTTQKASGPNGTTGVGGTNARQIGLGVKAGAINVNMTTQGASQSTGNPFDIMITGDAFFIVSNGSENFFTREGSFYVDGAGNLAMTSIGYNVMGWEVDFTQGLDSATIKQDTVKPLRIMSANNMTYPPEATTKGYVSGILDRNDSDVTSANGKVVNLNFFDNLGYSYTAKLTLKQSADVNEYSLELSGLLDSNGNPMDISEVEFGENMTQEKSVSIKPTEGYTWEGTSLKYGDETIATVTNELIEALEKREKEPEAMDEEYTVNGEKTTARKVIDSIAKVYGKEGATEEFLKLYMNDDNDNKVSVQDMLANLLSNDANVLKFPTGKEGFVADGRNYEGFTVNFDPNTGKFAGINKRITQTTVTAAMSALGGNFSDIEIDFSECSMFDNKGTSTVAATSGDADGIGAGRRLGDMIGVSIQNNGMIYASYDNGMTKLLGQIATAEFANVSGLEKKGDNLYSATMNSGDFDGIGTDITSNGGYMSTGQLEMSNVDLSSEFTEMITTQRGFQANSRIITVSDTLLEELTNLKR